MGQLEKFIGPEVSDQPANQESQCDTKFRTRTAMYVGSDEFSRVYLWIDGFDAALQFAFPDEVSDLRGFREWLLMEIGGSSNIGWHGIIREHYGDGPDATKHFFELFLEFRSNVRQIGLKEIFRRHYDYELDRYGGIFTAEYYSNGWHQHGSQGIKPRDITKR